MNACSRFMARLSVSFLNLKLWQKLALVYSVVVILPSIAIGVMSYQISETALRNEVVTYIVNDMDTQAERIDYLLSSWKEKASILTSSDSLRRRIQMDSSRDLPQVFDFYADLGAMVNGLTAFERGASPGDRARIVIYTDNKTLPKDNFYVQPIEQFPLSDATMDVLLKNISGVYWAPGVVIISGVPSIALCARVFDLQYRQVTGLVVVYVPLSAIQGELENMALPSGGQVIYTDATGAVICSAGDAVAPDHEDIMYFERFTPTNRGRLDVRYPKAYISSKIMNIYGATQFAVLVALILAAMVSFLLARLITRRLTNFANSMATSIESGVPTTTAFTGGDEIGVLNKEFTILIDRLDTLMQDKYKASMNRRVLELELLQYQVNPHFLYNVLSSIKWTGDGIVDDIVDSLVNFFRMTLNKGQEVVSIGTEMNIVREYIKIQQFIYDEEFGIDFHVDDEIQSFFTLKLILQPIVENAIIHGLSPQMSPDSKLVVHGVRDGDAIMLIVEDNGMGMDEQQLVALSDATNLKKMTSNYGVSNVRERLRLIYGDEFGIRFESVKGRGTRVTVRIPCMEREQLTNKLNKFI